MKNLKYIFIMTTIRIEKYVKCIKSIIFMELRQGARYIFEYDLRDIKDGHKMRFFRSNWKPV